MKKEKIEIKDIKDIALLEKKNRKNGRLLWNLDCLTKWFRKAGNR